MGQKEHLEKGQIESTLSEVMSSNRIERFSMRLLEVRGGHVYQQRFFQSLSVKEETRQLFYSTVGPSTQTLQQEQQQQQQQ